MATRLLLIDPDIAFMVMIKQALEQTGEFLISISANGTAASEVLARTRHDTAIVAFDIPDMDILELIGGLRQIQPGLPVIVTPGTPQEQALVRTMDVQGAIQKPYAARDLIPYVRSVLTRAHRGPRRAPIGEEFAAPQVPPSLAHLVPPEKPRIPPPSAPEVMDPAAMERLMQDLDEPDTAAAGADDLLSEWEALESPGAGGVEPIDAPNLAQLLEVAEPPRGTAPLSPPRGRPDTTQLPATEELEGRAAAPEGLPLSLEDEPPVRADDTPAVPSQDLSGVRQFLATEQPTPDSMIFGEVLDAVANASPEDYAVSPDHRAFHDLVDSLRVPAEPRPAGPKRLDDLLSSLAADVEAEQGAAPPATSPLVDGSLDQVLDAIRRGAPPLPPVGDEAAGPPELENATIGDVIQGLFDPSFEGVLAALSGEEIDDRPENEPTYGSGRREPSEGAERDHYRPEEMSADAESPAWLASYEPEPRAPQPRPRPGVDEPPVEADDSSRYPATAALNAVTGIEPGEDFSLNDLLNQIEAQLPPPRAHRPRLKPLPSWEQGAQGEDAAKLRAMFDRFEQSSFQAESRPAQRPSVTDETRPSQAIMDEIIHPAQDEEAEEPFSFELEPAEDFWGAVAAPPASPPPAPSVEEIAPVDSEVGDSATAPDFLDLDFLESDETFAGPDTFVEPDFLATGEAPAVEPQDWGAPAAESESFFAETSRPGRPEAASLDEVWGAAFEEEAAAPPESDEAASALDPFPAEADSAAPAAESVPPGEELPADEVMLSMAELLAMADLPAEAELHEVEPIPADDSESFFAMFAGEAAPAEAELFEFPPAPALEEETPVAERGEEPAPAEAEPFEFPPAAVDESEAFFAMFEEAPEAAPAEAEPFEFAPASADEDEAVRRFFAEEPAPAEPEPTAPAPADDSEALFAALTAEPVSPEAEWYESDIAEAFYAGVQEPDEDYALYAGEPGEAAPAAPLPLDDEHLIPVPLDVAARMLSGEEAAPQDSAEAAAEREAFAQIAVQLTQFSLESSAQATLLSRPGTLLAQAGNLPDAAMERLFQWVDAAWQSSAFESDSLIRFVTLPDTGDFLLYSVRVEEGMILSMAFHADTPVRTIRRQARRLSESLALVPEQEALDTPAPEAAAARTQPSRPTDLRPPQGLHVEAPPEADIEEDLVEDEEPAEPAPRAEGPYVGYSFLWLPYDPGLELLGELAEDLSEWIQARAAQHAWEVEQLQVRPDYVLVTLYVPQKTLPDGVVTLLMEDTTRRSEKFYTEIVSQGGRLWADGYYLVSPPRDLTEREIARFITYQRQSQLS